MPDNYKVLFLQGGATSQFAMVPMNLLRGRSQADYINTGAWSKKAIAEARRYCDVNVAASSEDSNFTTVPEFSSWQRNADAAYLHYTPNETIGGVEFHDIPDSGDVPLVADAGAQKNIGPAGLAVVIVRDDLIGNTLPGTPSMFDYQAHADSGSMLNTPPTFAWYLAGLVFAWLLEQGGLAAMAEINRHKSQHLYDAIEASAFYSSPVDPACRSWMNVPFTLANPDLDGEFLEQAKAAGLLNLKGHRSVGGMRASIYNAMPESGVQALIDFMQAFERQYG